MTISKCGELVCNLKDKEEYAVNILALKQALNYGLKFKKVHSAIQFRHEYWIKSYIDLNSDFEKNFFEVNEYISIWKDHGKCQKS